MSTINVEQILAANKSAVAEAQTLAATTLAGFEKLVELNMAAAKSALLDGLSLIHISAPTRPY